MEYSPTVTDLCLTRMVTVTHFDGCSPDTWLARSTHLHRVWDRVVELGPLHVQVQGHVICVLVSVLSFQGLADIALESLPNQWPRCFLKFASECNLLWLGSITLIFPQELFLHFYHSIILWKFYSKTNCIRGPGGLQFGAPVAGSIVFLDGYEEFLPLQ